MGNKPLISVVMSVFNDEKFLKSSIDSILNQSYKNFEFIIIDDGSTDRSLSIIKDYKKIDKRIIVVSKQNTGLTKSLNVGLRLSKGKYIARIDGDDISHPLRFEKQIEILSKETQLELIGTNCILIDEKGLQIGRKKYNYPTNFRKIKTNLLSGNSIFPHSSMMFKKSEIKNLGFLDEFFKKTQDFNLLLNLLKKENSIKCLNYDEPLLKIRKHSQQITYNEVDYYKYISLIDYYCVESNVSKISNIFSYDEILIKLNLDNNFNKILKYDNFRKELSDLFFKKHYIKLIIQILMNIDYFLISKLKLTEKLSRSIIKTIK